ncbi:MAG TPA: hypothetical protein VM008_00965 [Phycisphaerae bacterium]|nr:hypothetical protein [Phycisphaerae bacterium]
MSTTPDRLTPDTTRRPKTAADSARKPDRADDLFDDTVISPDPDLSHTVVESTARSTQADLNLHSPQPPLDHYHDPLSNKLSTHPVGTTVGAATGAAAGAAAGAALGATIGPIGAALGAAAGAIAAGFAGGIAGRRVSESIHPSTEDHYWQHHFHHRPYVAPGTPYATYRAAYLFGIHTRLQHCQMSWSQAEPLLQAAWQATPDAEKLPWSKASPAIQDAWDRLTPCDPDF